MKDDLLFKDPVLPTLAPNPLLANHKVYGDLSGLQAEFEAANYDVGKKLADGLHLAFK